MEEAVYVIRLKQQTSYDSCGIYSQLHARTLRKGQQRREQLERHLPSEHRYSASLVMGLGAVHVSLGVVSAGMAMAALFGGGQEAEANAMASGLWAGFLYVGAGVLGVLASTRYIVCHGVCCRLTNKLPLTHNFTTLSVTSQHTLSHVTLNTVRFCIHFRFTLIVCTLQMVCKETDCTVSGRLHSSRRSRYRHHRAHLCGRSHSLGSSQEPTVQPRAIPDQL